MGVRLDISFRFEKGPFYYIVCLCHRPAWWSEMCHRNQTPRKGHEKWCQPFLPPQPPGRERAARIPTNELETGRGLRFRRILWWARPRLFKIFLSRETSFRISTSRPRTKNGACKYIREYLRPCQAQTKPGREAIDLHTKKTHIHTRKIQKSSAWWSRGTIHRELNNETHAIDPRNEPKNCSLPPLPFFSANQNNTRPTAQPSASLSLTCVHPSSFSAPPNHAPFSSPTHKNGNYANRQDTHHTFCFILPACVSYDWRPFIGPRLSALDARSKHTPHASHHCMYNWRGCCARIDEQKGKKKITQFAYVCICRYVVPSNHASNPAPINAKPGFACGNYAFFVLRAEKKKKKSGVDRAPQREKQASLSLFAARGSPQ